jgi:hypothetical protein
VAHETGGDLFAVIIQGVELPQQGRDLCLLLRLRCRSELGAQSGLAAEKSPASGVRNLLVSSALVRALPHQHACLSEKPAVQVEDLGDVVLDVRVAGGTRTAQQLAKEGSPPCPVPA